MPSYGLYPAVTLSADIFLSFSFPLQHLLPVFSPTRPQFATISRSDRLLSLSLFFSRSELFKRITGRHTFSSFSFRALTHCIIEQPLAVQPPVAEQDRSGFCSQASWMKPIRYFFWNIFVAVFPFASAPGRSKC